jgi:ABC-type transport system involved in multi-copper enzyme maturation permease subunit
MTTITTTRPDQGEHAFTPPAASLPADIKVTQLRVIGSEWLKFRSLRSSYYTLGATVVAMIGFGCLFAGVTASRWAQMKPAQQAAFDPTGVSLRGYFLAQLVIGVLGVLIVTGEYSTGMIRASLSAAPTRLPVLWGKAIVFAVVAFVLTEVSAFVAFFAGQALLSGQHIQTTLSAPGVLRAVFGTGLYLTVVGLLGVGLGWIIRSTAGSIATLFGLLMVLPLLAEALPQSWGDRINPYLPSNAGQELLAVHHDPTMLAPWTGFGVFCLYAVAAIAVAAVLLKRRDA